MLAAARDGDTEGVRGLMAKGAPFTADWLGTSPLHLTAQFGNFSTCEVGSWTKCLRFRYSMYFLLISRQNCCFFGRKLILFFALIGTFGTLYLFLQYYPTFFPRPSVFPELFRFFYELVAVETLELRFIFILTPIFELNLEKLLNLYPLQSS